MTNVKEFSEKYYITEDTVIDCDKKVWEKFRQYVHDHVTKGGGISQKCANHTTQPSSDIELFIAIDKNGAFRWTDSDDRVGNTEYTKHDILNILHHYGHIKQEEQPMSKFKAMKFRVKDAEHSAHIQKYLFSLGYVWLNYGASVVRTDKHFLYAECNGRLAFGEDEETFASEPEQEHTLDVRTEVTYACNPVEPRATIELNGVCYYVDDLEKALQHIKPAENA